MPRFYFDFRQGNDFAPDAAGTDLADAEQAYLEAFKAAREMWSELLKERRDPRRCRFEVRDSNDALLFVLPFQEVLDSCSDRISPFPIQDTLQELLATHGHALRIKEELAIEVEMSKQVLRASHKLLKQPY